jgi:hypothetical protein
MSDETAAPPVHVSKLAAALAKAQSKIVAPEKNKTVTVRTRDGNEYSFDYADYGAIVAAIKGPLSENEICYTHVVEAFGGGVRLVTKLIHSSGEELSSIYPLPMPGQDPKGFGGAVTYGKRYSLSAITGCVADDDVDEDPQNTQTFADKKPGGQKAPAAGKPSPIKPSEKKSEAPTPAMLAKLFATATAEGPGAWTKEQIKEYMTIRWKIDSTKLLTRGQYDQLLEIVDMKTFPQACASILKETKV